MEKKKIALMSYAMDHRRGMGTALYTRRLIEELLKDTRFEWYLVHFDPADDPLYKQANEILMPRIHLPFATRFVRTMLFFWKYRKERFDIIHWFQPRLYPFFWLAPARHIVVTAHGAGDITAPGHFPFSRRAFNFVMRYFNRYIDAVIAVSEFGKREIVEWYRVPAEKVYVTYPGGGERFPPMSKEKAREIVREKYAIKDPFILDVSRLEPHKNVDGLIRAYALTRAAGVQHKLVIAGKASSGYEKIAALARSTGYGDDIIFVLYVDDEGLHALYTAADLFVFPSLNEGFGLPLVEAMSLGTPVITSNVTAPPEIVGDAGMTVDPTNFKELAGVMEQLLKDPKRREALSTKGLKRAKDFLWEKTGKETLDLYGAILGEAG